MPPAQRLRPREARLGQRPANPLVLACGLDREWAEQQRRPVTEADWPVADGTDQNAPLACHQAQSGQGCYALAIAVGGLVEPVGAERPVEQGFDLWPVRGPFVRQLEHGVIQRVSGGMPPAGDARRSGARTGDAQSEMPASSSRDGPLGQDH